MDGSQMQYEITAAELRAFIERVEQIRADEKDVFAEMKARGYMTRPVRTLIRLRAQDPDKAAANDAILETYKSALGML